MLRHGEHRSRLTQQALWFVLLLSAPPIVVAAVVGLLIAFVQAATQLQEQTLQYVAKFFAIVDHDLHHRVAARRRAVPVRRPRVQRLRRHGAIAPRA